MTLKKVEILKFTFALILGAMAMTFLQGKAVAQLSGTGSPVCTNSSGGTTTSGCPVFYPSAYGAVCNGTTDDSSAIQSAINAAVASFSTYGTGAVKLPSNKVCAIASGLVLPDTVPITLTSDGTGTAILVATASMTAMISKGTGAFGEPGNILNLELDGNLQATNALNIAVYRVLRIDGLFAKNTTGTLAVFGDGVSPGLVGLSLSNCTLRYDYQSFPTPSSRPAYNLVMNSNATDGSIDNCVAVNAKTAGFYINAQHTTLTRNHPFGFPLNTYYPVNGFELATGGTIAIGNYIDGVSGAGFLIDSGYNDLIVANRMFLPSGSTVTAVPMVQTLAAISNSTISENTQEGVTGLNNAISWYGGTPCTSCIALGNTPGNGGNLTIDSDATNGLTATLETQTSTLPVQLTFGNNYVGRWQYKEMTGTTPNFRLYDLSNTLIREDFQQNGPNFVNAGSGTGNAIVMNSYTNSGRGGWVLFNGGSVPVKVGQMDGGGNFFMLTSQAAVSGSNVPSPTQTWTGAYFNSSSQLDNWTAQAILSSGATPTSTMTFAHSGSSGTATVSVPALVSSGTVLAPFILAHSGTSFACSNVVLSSAWGSGGTCNSTLGTTQQFVFTLTSGSTSLSSNPTVAITFPTAWSTAPIYECKITGGTGTPALITDESAETLTGIPALRYVGTPTATATYTISCHGQ